jgi:hypothetical protein
MAGTAAAAARPDFERLIDTLRAIAAVIPSGENAIGFATIAEFKGFEKWKAAKEVLADRLGRMQAALRNVERELSTDDLALLRVDTIRKECELLSACLARQFEKINQAAPRFADSADRISAAINGLMDEAEYVGPRSPHELATQFEKSDRTISRMLNEKRFRFRRDSQRMIWVHPDDFQRLTPK